MAAADIDVEGSGRLERDFCCGQFSYGNDVILAESIRDLFITDCSGICIVFRGLL